MSNEASPDPPSAPEPRERRKLDTPRRVRRELARLYWKALATEGDRLDATSARKLGGLLAMIGVALEREELARRVTELERRLDEEQAAEA